MKRYACVGVMLGLLGAAACSAPPAEEVAAGESASIADADRITRRPDGLYDVVCRDGHEEEGVTVERLQSDELCKVTTPPSDDPFNPASCQGPALSAAAALAMLDVSRGVLEKHVGRFHLARRERTCYGGFSCSEWGDARRQVTAPFERLNATFTTDPNETRFGLESDGDVVVAYENNAPVLRLAGDSSSSSWGATFTRSGVEQSLSTASFDPTQAAAQAPVSVAYVYKPSRGCPNGHCLGQEHIPGTAPASFAGSPLTVEGVVTASCLRLAAHATESLEDANGNDYTLESELVITGDFATSSCTPRTCDDVAATCGALDDGCGGTLDCGSCQYNEVCDAAQGPAHCRARTPQEQCAASGRVWCPGKGCWDACSPY